MFLSVKRSSLYCIGLEYNPFITGICSHVTSNFLGLVNNYQRRILTEFPWLIVRGLVIGQQNGKECAIA